MKTSDERFLSEQSEENLRRNSSIKERSASESAEGIGVFEVTTPDAPYGYTEDGQRRKAPLTEAEIAERARKLTESQKRCKLHGTPGCTPCRQLAESLRAAGKSLPPESDDLPDATVGLRYSRRVLAPQHFHKPCHWSVEAITGWPLPQGLSLSSDGVLSGTPNHAGRAYFKVIVKDSSDPPKTASSIFSIRVNSIVEVVPRSPAPVRPDVSIVPPVPSEADLEKVRQELGISNPPKPKFHPVWREFYYQDSLSLEERRALKGSRPAKDKTTLAGMSPMNIAMFLTMPEVLYVDYGEYKNNRLKPRILTSRTAYDTTSRKGRKRSRKAWQFAGIKIIRVAADGVAAVSAQEIEASEPEQIQTDSILPRREMRKTEPTITWKENGEIRTITMQEALKNAKANRKRLESSEQKRLPLEQRCTDRKDLLIQQRFWDRRIEALKEDIKSWDECREVEVPGTGAESFMVEVPLCPEGTQPAFDMVLVREYIRTAWGAMPHVSPTWWRHYWQKFENEVIHRAVLANVFCPKWRVTESERSRALLTAQSLWDVLQKEEAPIRASLVTVRYGHKRALRTQRDDADQNYRVGDVNAQREEVVRSTDTSIREVRPSGAGLKSDEQDFWKG